MKRIAQCTTALLALLLAGSVRADIVTTPPTYTLVSYTHTDSNSGIVVFENSSTGYLETSTDTMLSDPNYGTSSGTSDFKISRTYSGGGELYGYSVDGQAYVDMYQVEVSSGAASATAGPAAMDQSDQAGSADVEWIDYNNLSGLVTDTESVYSTTSGSTSGGIDQVSANADSAVTLGVASGNC